MGETKLFGIHLWFRLHVALQLSGMVCFIVGFVYAWKYLPGVGNGDPTGAKVGLAHMYLGTIIMGLAGLQVIVGFVRPKPGSRPRPLWNILHHWLGRLTIFSAWVTVYMGIYMAHTSLTYQASYITWMVPIASVMGCVVLADAILSIFHAFNHGPVPKVPSGGGEGGKFDPEDQQYAPHKQCTMDPAMPGTEDLSAWKTIEGRGLGQRTTGPFYVEGA